MQIILVSGAVALFCGLFSFSLIKFISGDIILFVYSFQIQKEFREILEDYVEEKETFKKQKNSLDNTIAQLMNSLDEIDDIDITISINELNENTNAFIDLINRMRNKEKRDNVYLEYKNTLDIISENLNNFKDLKASGKLSSKQELEIQKQIDTNVSKCS